MKSLRVKASGITDSGLKRETNEDQFSIDDSLNLYIIADGMGGHLAGEIASAVAVDLIKKNYQMLISSQNNDNFFFGSPDPSVSEEGNKILASIRLANGVLHKMAKEKDQYRDMGTTVAVLALMKGKAVCANVGDSPIFLLRKDGIEKLSRDHTLASEQVAAGLMTAEEASISDSKHILTRNLGSSWEVYPEIFEIESSQGDKFLMCTDGLTDLVEEDELQFLMEQARGDPQALCHSSVKLALQRGGHDNTTVVSVFL